MSESIVIAGERVQVALVRLDSDAVTDVFSNPGEQFHYILEGELIVDIDGRLVRVPKHHAVHVPARLPCRILSGANAPVLDVLGAGRADTVCAPAARGERRSDALPPHRPTTRADGT